MIVYKDIDQRTEAWFKLKYGKIGGTRSNQLMIESESLMLELLAETTDEFELEDSFQSSAMIKGQEKEPFARKQLELYTGLKFIDVAWIQSELNLLLGISPDGLTEDYTIGCEIKCLEGKKHIDICLKDEIDKDHIHQCLHYFTVNDLLQKLYYCCFRPENKIKPLFVKELTRDSKIDLGFKIKGKVNEDRGLGFKDYVCNIPDIRTVQEWVDLAKVKEVELREKIRINYNQLNF